MGHAGVAVGVLRPILAHAQAADVGVVEDVRLLANTVGTRLARSIDASVHTRSVTAGARRALGIVVKRLAVASRLIVAVLLDVAHRSHDVFGSKADPINEGSDANGCVVSHASDSIAA